MVPTTGQSGATPAVPSSPPKKSLKNIPLAPPWRTTEMSYPSQKRRLRGGRGIAALVAALLAGGAGLATMPSAQAAPSVPGPAGTIQTMGGITRNYQQGGYGPEGVNAKESHFQNPRGLAFAPNGDLYVTDALNNRVRKID